MSHQPGPKLLQLEMASLLGLPEPFTPNGAPAVSKPGLRRKIARDPRLFSLYRHPTLANHPKVADAVARAAKVTTMPDGMQIRLGGSDDVGLSLILDGRIKLMHTPPRLDGDGRPTREERPSLLAWLGPGCWVGMSTVIRRAMDMGQISGLPPLSGDFADNVDMIEAFLHMAMSQTREALEGTPPPKERDRLAAELREIYVRHRNFQSVKSLTLGTSEKITAQVVVVPHTPGIRILQLSLEEARQIATEHPPFRAWLTQQLFMARMGTNFVNEQLERHPLTCNLTDTQRSLLASLAAYRVCEGVLADDREPLRWMSAGSKGNRVAMVVQGQGQSYIPGETAEQPHRLAADVGPGELIGHEDLVSPRDLQLFAAFKADPSSVPTERLEGDGYDEPPRLSDVYLAEGTQILEWDWEAFRIALSATPSTWLDTIRFVERGCPPTQYERVSMIAVLSDQAGIGVTTTSLGLAIALARRPENAADTTPQGVRRTATVVLADFDGERTWEERWKPLGLERHEGFIPGRVEPLTGRERARFDFWSIRPGTLNIPGIPDNLAIVWAQDPKQAPLLLSVASAWETVRRVVVAGGSTDQPWWPRMREVLNQSEIQVVWMTNQPGAHYTATDEVPQKLVRVDRVDASYRRAALERAQRAPAEWLDPDRPPDPSPALLTTGHMRMHDDAFAAKAIWRGEVQAVWAEVDRPKLAASMERLARIVEGESIGLALAGGGILGCSHMALLAELDLARVPIDYIAGSSIGAVVGALYAAGGTHLLERMLIDHAPRGLEDVPFLQAFVRTLRRSPFLQACTTKAVYDTKYLGEIIDGLCSEAWNGEPMPLECTRIPFYPVSANLNSQEAFAGMSGTVGFGVRASAGMPPTIPGMWRNGQRLLDGALVSNVPSHLLKVHGADFLIASNVMSPPDKLQPERMGRKLYNATVGRLEDVYNGIFLLAWKSGDDQGRLVANHLIDARTSGVWFVDWWRGWRLRDRARDQMSQSHLAASIAVQWKERSNWFPNQVSRIEIDTD